MKYIIANDKTRIKYTIKQIFKDNWADFVQSMKLQNKTIRNSIMREVGKIMDCQEPSKGYSLYVCPDCDSIKYVAFTCKSRFCNCCGVKYSQDRSLSASEKMLNCSHRHIVFTIPDVLRKFFAYDRKLLDLLFNAASKTVLFQMRRKNNYENLTPGMIATLHTFGRDLKWNPHIHLILTEGGINDKNIWKERKYINYEGLRHSWKYFVLKFLAENTKCCELKAQINDLYKKYNDGFYVRAAPNKNMDSGSVVNYILRYIGRPVMAQNRISGYTKESVEFWYKPHGKTYVVTENISSFSFISKLIIHIPDNNFKMLRYYGIYCVTSSKHKIYLTLMKKMPQFYLNNLRKAFSSWRKRIKHFFDYDPIKCLCGGIYEFVHLHKPCVSNKNISP